MYPEFCRKSKYLELTKEELVNEIKDRRAAGRKIAVDLRASEDKLAAALESDDLENGDVPSDPTVAPEEAEELTTDELSAGAAARADGVVSREVPQDLEEYKGQYRYLPTGEIFGLKILPTADVRANKTHLAKSPLKFWDGTAEEFRAQFDKV